MFAVLISDSASHQAKGLTRDKVDRRSDEIGEALQEVEHKGEDAVDNRVNGVEHSLEQGQDRLEQSLRISVIRRCFKG